MPYAKAYLRIILCGTLLQSVGFGLNYFIRGEGNPKLAMLTMLLGTILNAIFCPIFIFGYKMGVSGSALATVLAQGISGLWVISYFFSGKSLLKIRRKNLYLNHIIVKMIISLGVGQFIQEFATSIVNLILNKSLMHYGGDMAISAMGIVSSISSLVLMPLFGINQGAQPIIGYNCGAKKYERVKEALKLAILGGTVLCVLCFVLIEVFPKQIIGIFSKNDLELMKFAVYALRVYLIMLPVLGFQVVGSGYFMVAGKPVPAALLSLSRQVILFIPAVLILPLFLGLHGVIIAGPTADFLSFIITGFWLFKELRSLDRGNSSVLQEAL